METTAKKSRKRSTSGKSEADILTSYVDHVLDNGTRPASVFKFCTDIGISENLFYDHFGSFEGLEQRIWKDFIDRTISRLKADKAYPAFSAREKILAFYYTFFEELKNSRSFILVQLSRYRKLEIVPGFLKLFRSSFDAHIESVLNAGKTSGEVAKRPFLDKQYPRVFWLHMAFLIMYWKDDSSAGFENTDAAVEKSVNLAFDLIGNGAVDSALDFARFLYQTKMK